jgi:hypothetical protein
MCYSRETNGDTSHFKLFIHYYLYLSCLYPDMFLIGLKIKCFAFYENRNVRFINISIMTITRLRSGLRPTITSTLHEDLHALPFTKVKHAKHIRIVTLFKHLLTCLPAAISVLTFYLLYGCSLHCSACFVF